MSFCFFKYGKPFFIFVNTSCFFNLFQQGSILTFISIAKEFDLISLVVNERNITLSYLTYTYTSLNCYQLAACSSVVMIVLISVLYLIAKKVFGADIVKGWS